MRRTVSGAGAFLVVGASALAAASSASAQVVIPRAQYDEDILRGGMFARDRNISVLQRPKPGYEPLTIRTGALDILPTLNATAAYDDNVYVNSTNGVSDEFFQIAPTIRAVTLWPRHQLQAFGGLVANQYVSETSENTVQGYAGLTGRLDIRRNAALQAGASFAYVAEDRTSLQTPRNSAEPIRAKVSDAFIGALHSSGRWRLSSDLRVRDLAYQDGVTFDHAPLPQRYRDRTITTLTGHAEYALAPAFSVFADFSGNDRVFRNQTAGLQRNSSGYEGEVGADFDVGGLARGHLEAGYLSQSYKSPAYRDVTGFSARGSLEYFPTPLITVTVLGSRGIEDATIVNAGGAIADIVDGRVDYELLRNVILSAHTTYEVDEYRGIDRQDKRWVAGFSGRYLLNRAISIRATYDHIDRSSSGVQKSPSFGVNRIFAGLSYAF